MSSQKCAPKRDNSDTETEQTGKKAQTGAGPSQTETKDQMHSDQVAGHSQNDGNLTSKYCPPPNGISEAMWERFQLLRERKQNLTTVQHSRKRKRKTNKDGDKVTCSDSVPSDTALSSSTDAQRLTENHSTSHIPGSSDSVDADQDPRLSWVNVKPYLGVNDHLKGVDWGRHAAKSRLEKTIDAAIASQDFDTAEKLSDQLATREFGKDVAEAFNSKRYADKKKKEEDTRKERKKKKLDWGFDHKQRWETKGNM